MFVTGFVLPLAVSAQEAKHLELNQAVNIAVKNNNNIQIAELDRKVANANYHQTDAIFLPQVSVGYTALTTNNPLNAFGFLLQQESVAAADFDPSKLNNPGATQNYGASVDVKMPLVNLGLIYARKAAKKQDEVYKYKAAYMKDYISFEVQKAYTQLQFAYQAREILSRTLVDVKQIHQSVENFYNKGLVQKSDVLNAQVQVNTIESALAKAESNIANASDGLNLLMNGGDDSKSQLYITDSLEQKSNLEVSPEFSMNRSDVMAMQSALDASKAMVKSSAMNFLPKINAFGSYQLNDSKIFKFQNDSYLAGINLSWTIFSGNQNRSKVRLAIFQRDKMKREVDDYIDKSKLEVNKTARDIQDLNIEIRKQQSSVEHAYEALRITNNRYKEGLASTTDLLTSQAQLSQQQLGLAQAVMTYNITRYYQELLTTIK